MVYIGIGFGIIPGFGAEVPVGKATTGIWIAAAK